MKRTFLPRRNQLLSAATARLGLVLVALALGVLALRLIFPDTLLAAVRPVFAASDYIGAHLADFGNGFANARTLARERDTLLAENEALVRQSDALTAKVADLERLLGTEQAPARGIVAGVLAQPPESPYDSLIVAAGSDLGIAEGDSVSAEGGTPIGTVTEITARAARVTLLSAPGNVTHAWVGDARAPLILTGAGGGAFEAEMPRTASSTVGETVFVAGPGALPIGIVRGESGDPSSPTVELHIGSKVNIFSILYVLVTPKRGL